MSSFMCGCNEVIRDVSDNVPYKGHMFADTEYFDLLNRIAADIDGFIQSRMAGCHRAWIAKYFLSGYPAAEVTDKNVVHDIITRHLLRPAIGIYQCPKCGRLHVEHRDDTSLLESFTPDKTPHRDIFRQ